MRRSARRVDREAEHVCGCRHSVVVRHYCGQLFAQELGSGEVDGVEAAEDPDIEGGGLVEELVVDLHEIQSSQKSSSSRHRRRAVRPHGTSAEESR